MNKVKITMLLLTLSLSVFASKIHPLNYKILSKKSSVIIIGKVEDIQKVKKVGGAYKLYNVKVAKVSCIKGKVLEKKLLIPIRVGGVKGFSPLLQKNYKYVFFLNPDQQAGIYRLVHPKAIAKYISDIERSKKEMLIPKISIPLSGNKTTFRFSVKNNGLNAADIYGPFANRTRLVVVYPNGKKQELGNWKEGINLTDKLLPDKEIKWDVNITKHMELKG